MEKYSGKQSAEALKRLEGNSSHPGPIHPLHRHPQCLPTPAMLTPTVCPTV